MDITTITNEDLKKLMEKYKEKQERYNEMYNECTIRNEKIILNIHLEQVRRWRKVNTDAFTQARMDVSMD
jgi:hypothetical protein